MSILEFADAHPWWTFFYLLVIASILPRSLAALRGKPNGQA